jgi:hypothetical protein
MFRQALRLPRVLWRAGRVRNALGYEPEREGHVKDQHRQPYKKRRSAPPVGCGAEHVEGLHRDQEDQQDRGDDPEPRQHAGDHAATQKQPGEQQAARGEVELALDARDALDDSEGHAEQGERLIFGPRQGEQRHSAAVLLRKGVSPAARDDDATALHQAAAYGHLELVRLLIEYGAPLEARNRFGGTVLDGTLWYASHDPAPGVDYEPWCGRCSMPGLGRTSTRRCGPTSMRCSLPSAARGRIPGSS